MEGAGDGEQHVGYVSTIQDLRNPRLPVLAKSLYSRVCLKAHFEEWDPPSHRSSLQFEGILTVQADVACIPSMDAVLSQHVNLAQVKKCGEGTSFLESDHSKILSIPKQQAGFTLIERSDGALLRAAYKAQFEGFKLEEGDVTKEGGPILPYC